MEAARNGSSGGARADEVGEALADLVEVHALVDRAIAALARRHEGRLQCRRGCSSCCIDGIVVHEVEAERIRRQHADFLATAPPHPAGACAFLDDEGACRIHESRPYVCRTQGLPFRWTGPRDGSLVELREICRLNAPGPPIDELPQRDCWTLGPVEERLEAIQARFGGPSRRIALRSLFSGEGEQVSP